MEVRDHLHAMSDLTAGREPSVEGVQNLKRNPEPNHYYTAYRQSLNLVISSHI